MKLKFAKKNIIVLITTIIVLAVAFFSTGDGVSDSKGIEDAGAETSEQLTANTEKEPDEHNNSKDPEEKEDEDNKEEKVEVEDPQDNEEEPDDNDNEENKEKAENTQSKPQAENTKNKVASKEKNTTNNTEKKTTTEASKSTKKETDKKESKSETSKSKDKYQTDPVPEGKPKPVEPEDTSVTDKKSTAHLSVRADTAIKNIEKIDPAIAKLLPKDGVIFSSRTVTFNEGESVFDVLQREMRNAGIHMEASFTPMYNSAYVEGINNLYEFDGGELSGWMYKVNGWFPNYGASRYMLEDGDVIEWLYTLDLGRDIGGYVSTGE